MMIKNSELILNPDGSVYHLNLKPGQIANDIIFVGDQDRVERITKLFDKIEHDRLHTTGRWETNTFF